MPNGRALGRPAYARRPSLTIPAAYDDNLFTTRRPHSTSAHPYIPNGHTDYPHYTAGEQGLLAAMHTPEIFRLSTIKPIEGVNLEATRDAPPPSAGLSTPPYMAAPGAWCPKVQDLADQLCELALEALQAQGNNHPSLSQVHTMELQIVGRLDRNRSNTCSSNETQSSSASINASPVSTSQPERLGTTPSKSEPDTAEMDTVNSVDGSHRPATEPIFDATTSSGSRYGRPQSPEPAKSPNLSQTLGRLDPASTLGLPDWSGCSHPGDSTEHEEQDSDYVIVSSSGCTLELPISSDGSMVLVPDAGWDDELPHEDNLFE